MVFQQRNGRVDRYGQKHQPRIVYLETETSVDQVKGDLRILEILRDKDDQAQKNLGDPGAFLNVYDPDLEAAKIADYMARGLSADEVEAEMDRTVAEEDEDDGDFLLKLFQGAATAGAAETTPAPQSSLDHIQEPVSLFASDYEFARRALENLSRPDPIAQWSHDDASQTISITAPKDLENRLRQLPREVQADAYILTGDRDRMAKAIEEARQVLSEQSDDPEKERRNEASTWPTMHYLWPQHPILEWLGDRVLTSFGRQRAPVVQSHLLAAGEQAYVLMAMIPNRKAQPLLVEWRVASRKAGNQPFTLESFDDFARRAGLKARALPNPGKPNLESLQAGVPGAVEAMHRYMVSRQHEFAAGLSTRLARTLQDLEQLQARQIADLSKRIDQSRIENRSREIRRVFDEYRSWVEESMTTEPQPYIQLLAAVSQ